MPQVPDAVEVVCPECDRTLVKPYDESYDVVQRHNEDHHDGEIVAGVTCVGAEGEKVLPHPEDATDPELVKEHLKAVALA